MNQGWLDAQAHGPIVLLAWSAVSTKATAQGQVEGAGIGFDLAFSYYRPGSVVAAHGLVLLADAKITQLLKPRP